MDPAGSAYVTGGTASSDFPTTSGAFDTSYNGGGSDAFVAKLNPAGSSATYATFLGGNGGEYNGQDYGRGVAVDAAGNAYVTGFTTSPNFHDHRACSTQATTAGPTTHLPSNSALPGVH